MKNFQGESHMNDYDLSEIEDFPFELMDETDEEENYDSFKRGRFTIMVKKEPSNGEFTLKGKNIVFTGRGPYTRGTLMKMAREYGAFASTNTLSKNTDILVVGEKPGSKLIRAKRAGVKIIAIEEFMKEISE